MHHQKVDGRSPPTAKISETVSTSTGGTAVHECFFGCHFLIRPGGTGGPLDAKRKNRNLGKSEFQELQNRKGKNLENFHNKFVFRKIDLEIVFREIVLLF
jgi:hypothetical protein